MGARVVGGVGALLLGHLLWLAGMWLATNGSDVNAWVLVVVAVSVVAAVVCGALGWRARRRGSYAWTAFLWCLPVSPVLFSLGVLGATYL